MEPPAGVEGHGCGVRLLGGAAIWAGGDPLRSLSCRSPRHNGGERRRLVQGWRRQRRAESAEATQGSAEAGGAWERRAAGGGRQGSGVRLLASPAPAHNLVCRARRERERGERGRERREEG